MKISIIIPTKDEAELLPKLLRSIRLQDYRDFEVIVADAHSSDKTRDIAREAGAIVVDGGMPAVGRNAGAKAATGELFVFLDADVIIPPHFLSNLHAEMQERYIDVATCAIKPLSDIQLDRIIHKLINLTVLANLRVDPKAFGFCIFITRRLFERIGGFDETIKVAEDNDLVKRAAEFRNLRFINSTYLHVSVRRFEKEGRLHYMAKGIGLNIYRIFKGEIRYDNNHISYDFGGYGKVKENKKALDRIEERLIRLEKSYKKQLLAIKQWRSPKKDKEERTKLLGRIIESSSEFRRIIFKEEEEQS